MALEIEFVSVRLTVEGFCGQECMVDGEIIDLPFRPVKGDVLNLCEMPEDFWCDHKWSDEAEVLQVVINCFNQRVSVHARALKRMDL